MLDDQLNIDDSFGSRGFVNPPAGSTAIEVLSDGSFLVGGTGDLAGRACCSLPITKYDSTGQVVDSFGVGGTAWIDAPVLATASASSATSLKEDSAGRIVVGISYRQDGDDSFPVTLARLTSAGALDRSFDMDGVAQYSTAAGMFNAADIALRANDDIVVKTTAGVLLVGGGGSGNPGTAPTAVTPSPPSSGAPSPSTGTPTVHPPDTTDPTAALTALPRTSFRSSVTIRWLGKDDRGIGSYDLRYRTAEQDEPLRGYTYPSAWQRTSATAVASSIRAGATYCFSVRARDTAGNTSTWSTERCTARPVDDRAFNVRGSWRKKAGPAYYMGTARTTRDRGSVLTLPVARGRMALVASKGKGYGEITVGYNGKTVATIDLRARRASHRQLLRLPFFAPAKGTVSLRSASGGKFVNVDGLLTARR